MTHLLPFAKGPLRPLADPAEENPGAGRDAGRVALSPPSLSRRLAGGLVLLLLSLFSAGSALAQTIVGTVFEDVNYGGGSGRPASAAATSPRSGATVELYNTSSGAFVGTTTTNGSGQYSFNVAASTGYTVRVVNSTVTSSRTGYVAGLLPVQTYNGTTTRVGGESPALQDAAANSGSQNLSALTSGSQTAESLAKITSSGGATPVDFGFNFDVVVNANNAGQGSFRQFITNANALGGEASLAQSGSNAAGSLPAAVETSIFMIPDGAAHNGLLASGSGGPASNLTAGRALISVSSNFTFTSPSSALDATTQTFNIGNTNAGKLSGAYTGKVGTGADGISGTADDLTLSGTDAPEVEITGNALGADGLNLNNNDQALRGFAINRFNGNMVASVGMSANRLTIENNAFGVSALGIALADQTGLGQNNGGVFLRPSAADGGRIRNNVFAYLRSAPLELGITTSNTTISNNEFRNNGFGGDSQVNQSIYLHDDFSNVVISGNRFDNTGQINDCGIEIAYSQASSGAGTTGVQITDNTLTNTNGPAIFEYSFSATFAGGGTRVGTISRNIITGSVAPNATRNPPLPGIGVGLTGGDFVKYVVSLNSIYNNDKLGIDLIGDGVTLNATGTRTGINTLFNFPALNTALALSGNVTLTGYARPGSRIELFANSAADPTGFGEGQTYLGFVTEGGSGGGGNLAADTDGGTGSYGPGALGGVVQGQDNTNKFSFTIPLSAIPLGTILTATATSGGVTSEFSRAITVTAAPPVPNTASNTRTIANSAGATTLNPSVSATAGFAAVSYYTVTTLPTAGTLTYNGTALTSGNIAATQITNPALLTYTPQSGTTGTFTFAYTATDANGLTSTQNNNGGTITNGPATYSIAVGSVAVTTLTGTVFEDVNYGGGLGRPLTGTAGTSPRPNATVELYDNSGNFVATTTTNASGQYSFNVSPSTTYTVRVVSGTVTSSRPGYVAGLLPVQTYNGTTDRVGGENPAVADGGANTPTTPSNNVALSFTGTTSGNGAATDNTILVDNVQVLQGGTPLATNPIVNPSFENGAISGYLYNPSPATTYGWTFNSRSGIQSNGSAVTNTGGPFTSDGSRTAFIQSIGSNFGGPSDGSISQTFTLPAGTYTISFSAANRAGTGGTQAVNVVVNGTTILANQSASASGFNTYTTSSFTITGTGGVALGSTGAQSIASFTTGSGTSNTGPDFGFNFDVVTNTNNSGQGSLRQFITNSNMLTNAGLAQVASSTGGSAPAAGTETSIFMVPSGAATAGIRSTVASGLSAAGVAVITPATALPAITDAGTAVDGTTQTQNVGNTNNVTLGTGGTVGTAATALGQLNGPEVQITGKNAINNGLDFTSAAAGGAVRGLAIYGFTPSGGYQYNTPNDTYSNIRIAANNVSVSGNVVGTSATSFSDPGAATRTNYSDISITGGTGTSISNNLIGFGNSRGVYVMPTNAAAGSAGASQVTVTNNEIRSTGQVNTNLDGLDIQGSSSTASNNLFINNASPGLDTFQSTGSNTITGNTVTGNGFGTSTVTALETSGLRVYGANNTISQNVISNNYGNGILVTAGVTTTTISQNSIFGNGTTASTNGTAATGAIGIDLQTSTDNIDQGTAPYVSLNDGATTSGAANSLLDYPILSTATILGTNLVLTGFARPGATIELFLAQANSLSAPSATTGNNFGQGKTYLTTLLEGGTVNGVADTDGGTGSYSGNINGFNQGSDGNANKFSFTIPLSSLTAAQQAAITNGALLTSTATLATVGTSEFSGNVQVIRPKPLPVELTDFTAKAVRNLDAALLWHTAQEKNNDHFDVERSLNGTDYVKIGAVKGQGNKTTATEYALTDASIGPKTKGLVYYRLKQVDADGETSYSPVRPVTFTAASALTPAIALFPNPATSGTQLDLTGLPAGTYQVSVLDATGRVVLHTTLEAGLAHALDLNTIASGTYHVLVRGQANGQPLSLTKRLIKE